MKRIFLTGYSVALWTFFLASSILLFFIGLVIWAVTRWFDRRLYLLHMFSSFWGSCYIWFNPLWQVRIEGRHNIVSGRVYIMISNHQSMVDIPVLYHIFACFKWVSKRENFRIPIIGWLMRLNDYLEIDRGAFDSYKSLMQKSSKFIRQGSSIMIFPEGTRYPGGFLGPFRDGAFRMALDNKTDILPIVLEGTAKALPKKGLILTGLSRIRVRILQAVPYESFKDLNVSDLKLRIRTLMEEEYNRTLEVISQKSGGVAGLKTRI